MGSSWTRDWIGVPCIGRQILNYWTTREVPPCLFNLYAEYIMRNAGLEETQAGIKIARRNVSSIQFSRSVVSDSLRPHELQHARPPCPSPTPEFTQLTSMESVMPSNHLILFFPFSSCPQSFPALGSFPISQLFAWGGQSMEFQLQHQSIFTGIC